MFITNRVRGYDRDGSQVASGYFLCVFCDDKHNLFACVRYTRMEQFGNFMMGQIRIGTQKQVISGTYGEDGLPMDYDKILPENMKFLVPIPEDIKEIFWKGGLVGPALIEGPEAETMYKFGKTLLTAKQKKCDTRKSQPFWY
jgi:hypothetical protein